MFNEVEGVWVYNKQPPRSLSLLLGLQLIHIVSTGELEEAFDFGQSFRSFTGVLKLNDAGS